MEHRLLTIVVPTYNRADCLQGLLAALRLELTGLEGRVAVVIGDNASPDRTPELTAEFARAWADTIVMRHDTNVGADENFCRCIEQVTTAYFWIIGDDDLPRAGVIPALLPILEREAPDLVYLHSHWSGTLAPYGMAGPAPSLDAQLLDQGTFARRVHVWATFISGCVIRSRFAPAAELRRFTGTNLVQLGWVFGALRRGQRFVHVRAPVVFATAGNTGGYSVLRIFGQNFARITREVFSADEGLERLGEAIVRRTSIGYLPGLVWGLKHGRGSLGRFEAGEGVAAAMGEPLCRSLPFRLLIGPIGTWPHLPAAAALAVAWVAARMLRLFDIARERVLGTVRNL